jgi:hypothetical protein
VKSAENAWLFVGQALKTLPVSLLVAESPPQLRNSQLHK